MGDQLQLPGVKVKRTRKVYGPKTSAGCITCKKRRVKCDERRPTCKRCAKYGAECEGYKTSRPAAPTDRSVTRPILPNMKPLCNPPATVSKLFRNDQEFGCFQRFCLETARTLTGYRESEFWDRVVLQASEMEPCVRHAVVAIGALDFKKMGMEGGGAEKVRRNAILKSWDAGEGSKSTTNVELIAKNRLEFAYREYGKAISCLKESIAARKTDIRTSLIASLLFVCFEAYHGNSDSAAAQVYAGIEMMEDYSKQRRKQKMKSNAPLLPPLDIDILETFAMLEIQATSWGDKRSSNLHLERMRECEAEVGNIPAEFKTLRQASRSLSLIMLRGIHLRLSQSNKNVVSSSADLPIAPVITLGALSEEPLYAELKSVLSMFRQWGTAFEPYLRRCRGPNSTKAKLYGATMQQLQFISSYTWTAAASPRQEMYYRCYTKELRETVTLAKVMSVHNEDYFSLDFRIILPLLIVGWNYRHREMRREVIEIYRGLPRREGMWDASMVGKILEWISSIEEVGLESEAVEEYVPEDGVASLSGLRVDAEGRSAWVQCILGVRGSPGETILKETTVYW